MASKMAAAKFNTEEQIIFDNKVVALAGDGCLQEGVAVEAAASPGTRSRQPILIYDSNDVTLDAMAEATQRGYLPTLPSYVLTHTWSRMVMILMPLRQHTIRPEVPNRVNPSLSKSKPLLAAAS